MNDNQYLDEGWLSRFINRRAEKTGLRPRLAAMVIATVWLVAIFGFGFLIHAVDRSAFADVGDGFWWATQTVTTVGYGDTVPDSTAGRLVASVLMIGGLSFFAVITGIITSGFVARAQAARGGPYAGAIGEVQEELRQLRAEIAALSEKLDER